uniref:CMRF35-like molecule 7 n=1 Tax=Jaculus jaculus TaxID=51337 RepID=UPI001E1B5D0E|nr:CMRF35-like molecule 7 [Jaculus jaculus]
MWLPPALLLLSLPGCFFSILGPVSVRGPEQGSVTVKCHYNPRWKAYNKWWCQGANWNVCRILVQTTRSEKERKSGRVSIRDNQRNHSFEVTMERLRQEDTDTYWCGIEKRGTDLGVKVIVTVDPVETASLSPTSPSRPEEMMSSVSYQRTHYMLLVFVKVPALLILAGAVLWLKTPLRVPKEQWRQPIRMNLNSERLTKDTAP